MNYFFDESGNWSEPSKEKRNLIIGGLLLKNRSINLRLEQEINLFLARNNIGGIHANEMSVDQIEECYRIISGYIKSNDASVLIRCFPPKILHNKTLESVDDVYIDKASNLISDMVFGDKKINIEYDMKFNYSYPLNVISNLNSSKPQPIHLLSKDFRLKEDGYNKNKDRLLKLISNSLNRDQTNRELQRFFNIISLNDPDQESIKKQLITKYLWTELTLKIEQNELMRGKFKDRVQFLLEQRSEMLKMLSYSPGISLKFSISCCRLSFGIPEPAKTFGNTFSKSGLSFSIS